MDKPAGINLTKLKQKFVELNKDGLYATLFHYYSVIVFVFLVWIYFSSNFNNLPEVYGAQQASESQLYQSQHILRILFWIGIALFVLLQLASFWQRKLHETNSIPMLVLISGYITCGIFMLVSAPLYNFLRLYFTNTDPFKRFSTPFEVLSSLNYEMYGFFLILAIALFGFGLVMLMLRKFNLRLAVIRHR